MGEAYDAYVGRWSRVVAGRFLAWLDCPRGLRWLDVGCGTGALSGQVLERCRPSEVVGVDPSEAFLAEARGRLTDPRVRFRVGDAQALELPDDSVDVVVSALALNFVPDPARALAEFTRVVVSEGRVAAYVWDYADGMQMLRCFWDAAVAVDPAAADLDEGCRFPICRPEPLRRLWTSAGLASVTVVALDIPTPFPGFESYWRPFLGAQGPAPGYVASLAPDRRDALREALRARLPVADDGSLALTARAWAVQGQRTGPTVTA